MTGRFKKLCTTDPDASMATSGRNRRLEPSYKQHAVVDDARGVVLDVAVTTREANEGDHLLGGLDRATAGAIAPNEALRASKYLGRAIWRKWTGYHRRSRAETEVHCVKLVGQSLMARDFDRQVAELQISAAVLNGYTAPGTPFTEPIG